MHSAATAWMTDRTALQSPRRRANVRYLVAPTNGAAATQPRPSLKRRWSATKLATLRAAQWKAGSGGMPPDAGASACATWNCRRWVGGVGTALIPCEERQRRQNRAASCPALGVCQAIGLVPPRDPLHVRHFVCPDMVRASCRSASGLHIPLSLYSRLFFRCGIGLGMHLSLRSRTVNGCSTLQSSRCAADATLQLLCCGVRCGDPNLTYTSRVYTLLCLPTRAVAGSSRGIQRDRCGSVPSIRLVATGDT